MNQKYERVEIFISDYSPIVSEKLIVKEFSKSSFQMCHLTMDCAPTLCSFRNTDNSSKVFLSRVGIFQKMQRKSANEITLQQVSMRKFPVDLYLVPVLTMCSANIKFIARFPYWNLVDCCCLSLSTIYLRLEKCVCQNWYAYECLPPFKMLLSTLTLDVFMKARQRYCLKREQCFADNRGNCKLP